MSAQKNEATVRTWVEEAFNSGNVDAQAHIFSSAYTWAELPPVFGTGAEGLLKFVRAFRAGFPDLHFAIEDVVTNEDKVVWRAVGTGTNLGEFMGIPATGKSIKVQAIINILAASFTRFVVLIPFSFSLPRSCSVKYATKCLSRLDATIAAWYKA